MQGNIKPKGKAPVGTIGLFFAVAWLFLQGGIQVLGLPATIAGIVSLVIGGGLILFIIVLLAIGRVQLWVKEMTPEDWKQVVKQALKEDREEQTNIPKTPKP